MNIHIMDQIKLKYSVDVIDEIVVFQFWDI